MSIFSVIGKESHFIPKSEHGYGKTDNSRIKTIFKSKLGNMTDAEITKLKSDDRAFFNAIYSNRYGNGPEDGYKYRGRGFNQLTFKGSYEKYGKLIGADLVNNPDLLNNPSIAADVAITFLANRLKERNIDPNSFTTTDAAIKTFAQANAGWKKDATNAIAKARQISPNFQLA